MIQGSNLLKGMILGYPTDGMISGQKVKGQG